MSVAMIIWAAMIPARPGTLRCTKLTRIENTNKTAQVDAISGNYRVWEFTNMTILGRSKRLLF